MAREGNDLSYGISESGHERLHSGTAKFEEASSDETREMRSNLVSINSQPSSFRCRGVKPHRKWDSSWRGKLKFPNMSSLTWTLYVFLCLAACFPSSLGVDPVLELYSIPENAPKGTEVGIVGEGIAQPPFQFIKVTDSPEVFTYFSFDKYSGKITVTENLDRENIAEFALLAISLSPRLHFSVRISILDINDNSPEFSKPFIALNLSESSPISAKTSLGAAIDPDLYPNTTARYEIMSGNWNNAFRVRGRELDGTLYCDLVVNARLDYDSHPKYDLVVRAFDGGSPPRHSDIDVRISLLDVNDNQPLFNQSRYTVQIMENATTNTPVTQVQATDLDSGENGNIRYHIERSRTDSEGMFDINSETGIIFVNKVLDYETKSSYELVVVAKDNGSQPLETSAIVAIALQDVNDNKPTIDLKFLTESGSPKISEKAAPGDYIARISVSDRDGQAQSSYVNVTLIGGEGHFGLTTRDSVVYLVILSLPVDREQYPYYNITVIAEDSGDPPLKTVRLFHLRVLDSNDNAPRFTKDVYDAEVQEVVRRGTRVLTVSAVDPDEGSNSALTYALSPDDSAPGADWFEIDPQTGVISTRAQLDCETNFRPELLVTAEDGGNPPLTGTATVRIAVKDVNDNQPVFDQSFYNVTVAENVPEGSCITKVSATDPDCGLNAEVTYSIAPNLGFSIQDVMSVHATTGEVCLTAELDFETKRLYEFQVIAADHGNLPTTAMVKVTVTDVNDNRPVFYPTAYSVNLNHNYQPGQDIVVVQATDRDTGLFGRVSYSISGGNDQGLFSIDPDSGVIKLLKSISHLTNRTLIVSVSARDARGLRSSEDARVTVSVIGSDLQPPIFEFSLYQFAKSEDVGVGTTIGVVTASGSANDAVQYSIVSGDEEEYFIIEEASGRIVTAKQLDHDTDPVILLNIQALAGSPPLYGKAQVNISISDVNDNPPKFAVPRLEIIVREDLRVGETVYVANAPDVDSGLNGTVRYRLVDPAGGRFSIDPLSGAIKLVSSLDFETQKRYDVIVNARDLGVPVPQDSNMTLSVKVQDVNDHSPQFVKSSYNFTVNEGESVNKIIGRALATDADAGSNGRVTYSLSRSNDDASSKFSVIPAEGSIYVREPLDRETQNRFELTLTASDGGLPIKTAKVPVIFTVTDANDNPPEFPDGPLELSVPENQQEGTSAGVLHATDRDVGENADITYSLLSGPSELFYVHATEGNIITRRSLDREANASYTLTVQATDGGVKQLSGTVQVLVLVLDENDNAPVFVPRDPRRAAVKENRPAGTPVVKMLAQDADFGINGTVHYFITQGGAGPSPFAIDVRSGWITTTAPLDHEAEESYRVFVTARDRGTPAKEASTYVDVSVENVLQEGPEAGGANLTFSVSEGVEPGYTIGQVAGHGSDVSFSLTSGDDAGLFAVGVLDGEIWVVRPLDHELAQSHRLDVTVSNRNAAARSASTVVSVVINVADQNDNCPEFAEEPIHVSVAESAKLNSVLQTITATDRDSGLNGQVYYTLLEASDPHFQLEPLTGDLTLVRPLDFETRTSYTLLVQAEDQSPSTDVRCSSTAAVIVTVTDVNDNSPVFRSRSTRFVLEDEQVSRRVLTVIADDADAGENGHVRYSLVAGNTDGAFHLEAVTGDLTVARPLDYEYKKHYTLNVTASDRGSPAMTSWQSVDIYLVDVNDNPPEFEKASYTAEVPENTAAGYLVTRVMAQDVDTMSNGALVYSIQEGMGDSLFSINSTTGEIRTRETLDREMKEDIIVVVYVRDGAFPAQYDSTAVHVTVTDENDNAPVFPASDYVISVPENHQMQNIFTAVATDADAGTSGDVYYSLAAGNNDGRFAIEMRNGTVSCLMLDRERTANHTLQIMARDRGTPARSAYMSLVVRVTDENDNAPAFGLPRYSVPLQEDLAPGSVVQQVSAVDADSGDNARLTYALLGETTGKFTIDPDTGDVTTMAALDREKESNYKFKVTAMDGHLESPLTSTVEVEVRIDDVNDCPPVFLDVPMRASIIAGAGGGTEVFRVVTSDADAGINKQVVYSLLQSQYLAYFQMDANTGVIKTKKVLTPDLLGRLTLKVVARDQGSPSLSSTGVIVLTVGPQTTPPLTFRKAVEEVYINENVGKDTELLTLRASRTDGSGSTITYSLESHHTAQPFRIESNTGTLYVNNPEALDFEVTSQMTVLVRASSASGSDFAFCTVRVMLRDVNDNDPKFSQTEMSVAVTEKQDTGLLVAVLSATDADSGVNGNVTYRIVDGHANDHFVIQPPTSGHLLTNIRLDRKFKSRYRLEVEAIDGGSPPRTATAFVTVNVLEFNDHAPFFPRRSPLHLSEDTRVGELVAMVTANDEDIYPPLIYSLGTSAGSDAFTIDRFTGKVTLAKPLDYDVTKSVTIVVEASDSVHTSSVEQEFLIDDENNNAPVFLRPFYAHALPEKTPPNTPLLTVAATDADDGENGRVTYAFEEPVFLEFKIDPDTGTIYSNTTLEFDARQPTWLFVVSARDHGEPPLTARTAVRVHVADTNYFPPAFTSDVYRANVSEGARHGTPITTVTANDRDYSMLNQKVDYRISGGNGARLFEIEGDTGQIVLRGSVDRETTSQYELVVTASDRGTPRHNATTAVFVTLTDVNDCAPEFPRDAYDITVPEDTPAGGLPLLTISATDRDLGDNGTVKYYITAGNSDGLFALGEDSGNLTLVKELDYERSHAHVLTITARDGATTSPLSSVVGVTVNVSDVNDNAPAFPARTYVGSVPENADTGAPILRVAATDPDTAPAAAALTYSLQSADGASGQERYFNIHQMSGDVTTAVKFDYEARSKYRFNVVAADEGGLRATGTVEVLIVSADEFAPTFEKTTYNFTAPGTAEPGFVVGRVRANDKDQGADGRVTYSFKRSDDYFALNATSGEVSVAKSLSDNAANSAGGRRRRRQVGSQEVVRLEIVAGSGLRASLSDVTTCEVRIDHDCCATTDEVSQGGLSETYVVLIVVLVLVIVLVIVGVIVYFLRFKDRSKSSSRNPEDFRHTNGGFQSDGALEFGALPAGDGPPQYSPRLRGEGGVTGGEHERSQSSSGRGSAEDSDEEVCRINQAISNRQSATGSVKSTGNHPGMPDSGCPPDTEPSPMNHHDYLKKMGVPSRLSLDSRASHETATSNRSNRAENHLEALLATKLQREDEATGTSLEMAFNETDPSHAGSITNITSPEEERGVDEQMDRFLSWQPTFQPLAEVFGEIARLKDESVQPRTRPTQIVPQVTRPMQQSQYPQQSARFPPPIISGTPPRAVPAAAALAASSAGSISSGRPETPSEASSVQTSSRGPLLPPRPLTLRSPITHDMASGVLPPSFAPAQIPLATRSPAPVMAMGVGQRSPRESQQFQFGGVPLVHRSSDIHDIISSNDGEQELRI